MIKFLKKIFKILPYLDLLYHFFTDHVKGDVSHETEDNINNSNDK